jgi:hypothetical protein
MRLLRSSNHRAKGSKTPKSMCYVGGDDHNLSVKCPWLDHRWSGACSNHSLQSQQWPRRGRCFAALSRYSVILKRRKRCLLNADNTELDQVAHLSKQLPMTLFFDLAAIFCRRRAEPFLRRHGKDYKPLFETGFWWTAETGSRSERKKTMNE